MKQVDAIITCEPRYLPDNLKIPVISLFNSDKRFDYVGYSAKQSITFCLDYLQELGHKKIAYIGLQGTPRAEAFHNLVRESDIVNFPTWNQCPKIVESDFFSVGATYLEKIWEQEEHPTALIAHNDIVSIGAIRKAWELGIRIPGDLSIIGFDDMQYSQYCIPSLTTIRRKDENSIAKILFEKIFARLKNNALPRTEYIIQLELIIRESCGKLSQ